MKYRKTTLIIGVTLLALGVILAGPVFADLGNEQTNLPPLYYFDEETGEYIPWYPPWYDPENLDSYSPPGNCPWWDSNGDGEFDWMHLWGRRSNNQEDDSRGYGRGHRSGCGGYGSQSNNRYRTS